MSELFSGESAALSSVSVERWHDGMSARACDTVAVEVPVALEYNGISHAVMMASPHDLEDFALGFSVSEGILGDASELYESEVFGAVEGVRIALRISAKRFVALKELRRNLTGRTGCGLCGTETLQQAVRHPPPVNSAASFFGASLLAGMAAMHKQQVMQQQSGATHAAAWMSAEGDIVFVREDVGRHNALDKLIGAILRAGLDRSTGAVLITSRASVEMVQKVATLGIGMLVAISAPTSLAIELAQETGVGLLGFVRQKSYVVYAHPERLLEKGE